MKKKTLLRCLWNAFVPGPASEGRAAPAIWAMANPMTRWTSATQPSSWCRSAARPTRRAPVSVNANTRPSNSQRHFTQLFLEPRASVWARVLTHSYIYNHCYHITVTSRHSMLCVHKFLRPVVDVAPFLHNVNSMIYTCLELSSCNAERNINFTKTAD